MQEMVPARDRRFAFFTIFLAGFLAGIAVRTLTIALPVITIELNVPLGVASWVSNGYYIVLASSIVTIGKIADVKGLKKIFLWGMAIFAVASVLCPLAVDIYTLIAARMIQALGSAMFIAASPALIVQIASDENLGQVQGILAASTAAGTVTGWAIGGIFIDISGWRSIFVPVIVLSVALFLLGRKYLPEFSAKPRDTPFDIPGAVLFFIFLFSVTGALSVIEIPDINFLFVEGLLVTAAVSGLWYGIRHFGKKIGAWSERLVKSRNFYLAISASILVFLVYSGVCFILPFALILGLDLDPAGAGLLLMGITVAQIVAAPFAGRAADRYGPRVICVVSIIGLIVTTGLFSFLRHGMGYQTIILLVLFWAAFGSFLGPVMTLLFRHCGDRSKGQCSGIIMTSRYFGFIMGIALFTIVFTEAVYAAGLPRNGMQVFPRLTTEVQVVGFADTFIFAAIVATVALVLILLVPEARCQVPGCELEEKNMNVELRGGG